MTATGFLRACSSCTAAQGVRAACRIGWILRAVISQKLLNEAGFDGFVETICKPFYAPRMGAPAIVRDPRGAGGGGGFAPATNEAFRARAYRRRRRDRLPGRPARIDRSGVEGSTERNAWSMVPIPHGDGHFSTAKPFSPTSGAAAPPNQARFVLALQFGDHGRAIPTRLTGERRGRRRPLSVESGARSRGVDTM